MGLSGPLYEGVDTIDRILACVLLLLIFTGMLSFVAASFFLISSSLLPIAQSHPRTKPVVALKMLIVLPLGILKLLSCMAWKTRSRASREQN